MHFADGIATKCKRNYTTRMAKKKPQSKLRNVPMVVMCTAAEKKAFEAAADRADQSLSDWVRKLAKAEDERTKR